MSTMVVQMTHFQKMTCIDHCVSFHLALHLDVEDLQVLAG